MSRDLSWSFILSAVLRRTPHFGDDMIKTHYSRTTSNNGVFLCRIAAPFLPTLGQPALT